MNFNSKTRCIDDSFYTARWGGERDSVIVQCISLEMPMLVIISTNLSFAQVIFNLTYSVFEFRKKYRS